MFQYRELPGVELPEEAKLALGARLTEADLLKAELAEQFFEDLYAAIFEVAALRKHDDRRLVLFSQIVQAARSGDGKLIGRLCEQNRISKKATAKVREALSWYEEKFATRELEGPAVALAYRDFITSDQTRKGLKLFTGNSQQISLPPYLRRVDSKGQPSRNTGRYFTPSDIIRQMVRLADIQPNERVIDPFCGSGGFLAEAAMAVGRNGDPEEFICERLVGIDEDPFCVEATRTLLGLMFPRCQNRLNVFLHNALYDRAPEDGEYNEDRNAEPFLASGTYDVVIGNPPGNKQYSGSNAEHVADLWRDLYGQTTGFWDHVFFVRRAVDLANPEGGRICILVPDGFLANSQFQRLRNEVMAQCEVRTIISLPRVFKNNKAKMSLIYLIRTGATDLARGTVAPWNPSRKAFLASIPETTEESDPEKDGATREVATNIYAELERLVEVYQEAEARNPASGEGPGLAAFPEIVEALRRPGNDDQDDEEVEDGEQPGGDPRDTTAPPATIVIDKPALRPGITDYSRDELIEALCVVLQSGDLHREEAIRRAARFLQERSGLGFTRVRRNGPIWSALKSAINAGVRRNIFVGTPVAIGVRER